LVTPLDTREDALAAGVCVVAFVAEESYMGSLGGQAGEAVQLLEGVFDSQRPA